MMASLTVTDMWWSVLLVSVLSQQQGRQRTAVGKNSDLPLSQQVVLVMAMMMELVMAVMVADNGSE